ncbi:nicotinate-nucleotide adenylyltransferase [Halorhodospira halochloris]|uniref:nicotinate-nucleotide adenylyltransferase n=1 Tax=Halorhodospira halochloris TaxID=1052 RepID=UPI001EE80221|nr:nicotinate-nucleotide adenylyltransferase [Halorhodospira halochloris]
MTIGLQAAHHSIGILGGTFDPIHYGHLRPAEEVREALQLSELRFMPARIPPHRARPRLSPHVRAELVELAIADNPAAVVDTRELHREGPSYTVDTLVQIWAEQREKGAQTSICLILGYDTFLGLPGWSRWRQLFDLAHIVVAERPGVTGQMPAELAAVLAERHISDPALLHNQSFGGIYVQPVTPLPISATGIRRALANCKSVRYLLPERVRERIVAESLYGYRQL